MAEEQGTAPDSTAVRTALWRALHVELDAPPHVLEDEAGLRPGRRPAPVNGRRFPDREGLAVSVPFPEPTTPAGSRAEVFTRYLAYFRDRLAAKLRGLPPDELRRSRVESGWTPLELLKHLTHVELRWLEWGFEGRDVAAPWGDSRDGHWYVAPGETLDGLLAALDQQAARSDAVIAAHDLDELGQPGERWDGEPPGGGTGE